MSKSDDLESEIKGLFTKSIEQVEVRDEVVHASHIANRQRGFFDAIIMICVGAMAVFTAMVSADWTFKHTKKQGDKPNE